MLRFFGKLHTDVFHSIKTQRGFYGSCAYSIMQTITYCLNLFALLGSTLVSAADVLTNNYDDFRTGANLSELTLNVANVTLQSFGRMFSYAVDGPSLSQPLVATRVDLPDGARRDLVIVTTASNSVYAFDAEASGDGPIWRNTLVELPGGAVAEPSGIFSTPVIDRKLSTVYVVAGIRQGDRPKYILHALNLSDGQLLASVLIEGALRIGAAAIAFEPSATRIAVQRAALAIAKGKVIVAFGGDFFEGWVFAFDQADLTRAPGVYCTTCASRVKTLSNVDFLDSSCILLGPGGGIWQSGRGPVVDANGLVYFFTGNKQHVIKKGCIIPPSDNACSQCKTEGGCLCKGIGNSGVCRGPDVCQTNVSESLEMFDTNEALIQLDPSKGLKLTGWFRPANWNIAGADGLEINDLDLGGSGPLMIPGDQRIIGGGKQGVMYVLDTQRASGACVPSPTQTCIANDAIQSFQVAPPPPRPNQYYRHILGGPVIWTRKPKKRDAMAYVWRENDHLRAYRIGDQFLGCNTVKPAATTSHNCPSIAQSEDFIDHHPGGILAVSANGADSKTAIVWAATTRTINGPGKLMAFKAEPQTSAPNLLSKIWDSDLCVEDRLDLGADFVPPTIANGKVYLATNANRIDVFGVMVNKKCTEEPLPKSFGPMLQ